MIEYKIENEPDPLEFRQVLINSTLGERRPVNDEERIRAMVKGANLIITARVNNELIGVARSLTDFAYCTYLSELAVDEKFQHRGVGKELIRRTKEAAPSAKLILLSAPGAINYYPKIGMTRHENCFYIDDIKQLK